MVVIHLFISFPQLIISPHVHYLYLITGKWVSVYVLVKHKQNYWLKEQKSGNKKKYICKELERKWTENVISLAHGKKESKKKKNVCIDIKTLDTRLHWTPDIGQYERYLFLSVHTSSPRTKNPDKQIMLGNAFKHIAPWQTEEAKKEGKLRSIDDDNAGHVWEVGRRMASSVELTITHRLRRKLRKNTVHRMDQMKQIKLDLRRISRVFFVVVWMCSKEDFKRYYLL